MKLKQTTIDAIKNLGKINDGLVIHKGKRLRTQDNLNKTIAYIDIEDEFPRTFGIYDVKEFLKAIKLVHNAELTFEDTHVLITNKEGIELVYQYANIEFVTEAPETFPFPSIDPQSHADALARYDEQYEAYREKQIVYIRELKEHRERQESIEESESEFDAELESLVESLNENVEVKASVDTKPVAPILVKPDEPKEPTKPIKVVPEDFINFSIDFEVIEQVVKACKNLGLEHIRFYSESDSETLYISTYDKSNAKSHVFKVPLAQFDSKRVVEAVIHFDRFTILPKGDYSVSIHAAGKSQFKNDTHTYYLATEAV
ncbi:TPA: hypothetical protein L3V69_001424 [Vibrio parahaemolyticus]|nr:hypothetical protein [Vibrio parahaemolyticus]HBN6316409.1 hypothetical protein [Vibrio parahaemolyticus]HCD5128856.1 hypothetical protein [Vibrio parahaemolyticus]HCD5207929.1 hypothetical protein [Vibrio parahaemolyticus]